MSCPKFGRLILGKNYNVAELSLYTVGIGISIPRLTVLSSAVELLLFALHRQ